MPSASSTTSVVNPQSSPFIRTLTSSSPQSRTKALSSLKTYLSHNSANLSSNDFLKLHKALWYAMYMTDKRRNQQQLALSLAALAQESRGLRGSQWIAFTRAFWATMGSMWDGLDKLRMDKFLFLVRCWVRADLGMLAGEGWEGGLVDEYCDVLGKGPLSPRDVKVPVGLRLHILDVFVDELERVDADKKAPVEELLKPIRRLGKESLVKSVRERVKEVLGDERLGAWREDGDEVPELAGTVQEGVARSSAEVTDQILADVAHDGDGEDENEDEWGGFDAD